MILRQVLILIVSALVLFFSYKYYKDTFCKECCTDNIVLASEDNNGPILFNWNKANAITNEKFPDYRTSILAEGSDTDIIEITGHYFADEVNETEFVDLGKARAEIVKAKLKEERPNLNAITNSKLVEMLEGADTELFESFSYTWTANEDETQHSVEIDDEGEAKILFPFNSSTKIDSPTVDTYLDSVADQLKADESLKVTIVGYADSVGEPGQNRRLSERRAKKIRDILLLKNVPRKQIITAGRGEADAIAPNTTKENRQLNRRVELKIQ